VVARGPRGVALDARFVLTLRNERGLVRGGQAEYGAPATAGDSASGTAEPASWCAANPALAITTPTSAAVVVLAAPLPPAPPSAGMSGCGPDAGT